MFQEDPRSLSVNRRVFEAIGNPDVGNAQRTKRPPEMRADLAAGEAMIHPEAPDAFITARQGEAAGCLGVREEGAVEIQTQAARFGPVDPRSEVRWAELVALHFAAAGLCIDGVQVQAMLAGDQPQCLLDVGTQLAGVACLAGEVAR